MRTIVFLVIVMAIVVVLVLDGFGMYVAHRTAVEVATGAAEQAARAYMATGGSETSVEKLIQGIADEAGVQLVSAGYHKVGSRWYEVTVRAEPDSFVLRHLPYLKDHIAQQSTAVVHF